MTHLVNATIMRRAEKVGVGGDCLEVFWGFEWRMEVGGSLGLEV